MLITLSSRFMSQLPFSVPTKVQGTRFRSAFRRSLHRTDVACNKHICVQQRSLRISKLNHLHHSFSLLSKLTCCHLGLEISPFFLWNNSSSHIITALPLLQTHLSRRLSPRAGGECPREQSFFIADKLTLSRPGRHGLNIKRSQSVEWTDVRHNGAFPPQAERRYRR